MSNLGWQSMVMPKQFSEQLSNRVAHFREERSISQQTLADEVSVSRQTIIAIEKGNYSPTVLLAMKIAKYFNVCVDELFSYE